jgi:hypothetical protein
VFSQCLRQCGPKAHSDRKRQICFEANPRLRGELLPVPFGPSFFVRCYPLCTSAIRRLIDSTSSRTLFVGTVIGVRLVAVTFYVFPMSCQNRVFIFSVSLCFVSAALVVLLTPSLMCTSDVALAVPLVVCVFPPSQLFWIASKVSFLLLVQSRLVLFVVYLPARSYLYSIAFALSGFRARQRRIRSAVLARLSLGVMISGWVWMSNINEQTTRQLPRMPRLK